MRGAPISAFSADPFALDEYVQRICSEIPRVADRKISAERQISRLKQIYKNVLGTNYLFTISSFPSDNFAKYIGTSLMAIGYKTYLERKLSMRYAKKLFAPPLWYRVYNGYKNPILDEKQNPCMLIISNVFDDSGHNTNKIDKLRDVLDAYDNIPRIVITSSKDPIAFSSILKINSTAHLFLGPKDRIHSM